MNIYIRPAKPADIPQIADLHIKAWRFAYKGIIHQSYLDNGLDLEERMDKWVKNLLDKTAETFLAFDIDQNQMAGFTTLGEPRDESYADYAELMSLYLHPDYFGKGVGNKLFKAAVSKAIKNGHNKMYAGVLTKNRRGRDFYERMGGVPLKNSRQDLIVDDRPYPSMKYEWEDLK